jgi:hypothetical protein
VPALAGCGEVVAGEGFAAGSDRVQGVALGPVTASGPRGPVDLDHPLALVDQEPGQPGSIAAGAFQGPHPPTWSLGVGQLEQAGVAGPVAWHLQGGPDPAVGVKQGRGVAVAVGVDPDDGVDLALEHGHGGCSFKTATVGWYRPGLESPRGGRTVRGHASGRTGF